MPIAPRERTLTPPSGVPGRLCPTRCTSQLVPRLLERGGGLRAKILTDLYQNRTPGRAPVVA